MSNTPIQALHNYHQTAKSLNLAKRIELKELLGITEVCRIIKTELMQGAGERLRSG